MQFAVFLLALSGLYQFRYALPDKYDLSRKVFICGETNPKKPSPPENIYQLWFYPQGYGNYRKKNWENFKPIYWDSLQKSVEINSVVYAYDFTQKGRLFLVDKNSIINFCVDATNSGKGKAGG